MTRFGFVSTYPPTLCGLATFTAALHAELGQHGSGPAPRRRSSALGQPGGRRPAGRRATGRRSNPPRRLLDDCDVVIVQHEYGVYGGTDGDEVLALLAALRAPSVVVLHTVLSEPTPNQRRVLEAVTELADAVVTMTGTAHAATRRRLRRRHVQGHRDPARRRSRSARADAPFPYRSSDHPDLGPDRSGQGRRVGHRGDGPTEATSTRRRTT